MRRSGGAADRRRHPHRGADRARGIASVRRRTAQRYLARGRTGVRCGVGRESAFAERSEEHTSELQSLMRNSYAVFCLKKKNTNTTKYDIINVSSIRYYKGQTTY